MQEPRYVYDESKTSRSDGSALVLYGRRHENQLVVLLYGQPFFTCMYVPLEESSVSKENGLEDISRVVDVSPISH